MERLGLKPRLCDLIPLAIALLLIIAPFLNRDGNGEQVRVICVGETLAILPLSTDTVVAVESRVGPMTIRVADGGVFVEKASCPRKICVKMGTISRPNRSIVCAPGRVAIIIEGRSDIDGITR